VMRIMQEFAARRERASVLVQSVLVLKSRLINQFDQIIVSIQSSDAA
jgi:hypothetical protein